MKKRWLTEVEKKKYISRCGVRCPYCESYNIAGGTIQHEEQFIAQNVICNECMREWTDIYTLSEINEIDETCVQCCDVIGREEYNELDNGYVAHTKCLKRELL